MSQEIALTRSLALFGKMRNTATSGSGMAKDYSFNVVVEPDGDKWHAYCPELEKCAAATWGNTHEEAYKNIHEVIQMILDELTEVSDPLAENSV